MSYNIHKGRYYYELPETLSRMKKECFICGTNEQLQPHHIRQVKTTNSQYSDENNVVLLCRDHHKKYHNQYRKVNQKTFAEYCIRQKQKEINKLTRELNKIHKRNGGGNVRYYHDEYADIYCVRDNQINGLPLVRLQYSDEAILLADHLNKLNDDYNECVARKNIIKEKLEPYIELANKYYQPTSTKFIEFVDNLVEENKRLCEENNKLKEKIG